MIFWHTKMQYGTKEQSNARGRKGRESILMQEYTQITGIVLKAEPIGEYDRRVVILTKEKGKISAFARGARKPNSMLRSAIILKDFGKILKGLITACIFWKCRIIIRERTTTRKKC